jgi:hypothetical protein
MKSLFLQKCLRRLVLVAAILTAGFDGSAWAQGDDGVMRGGRVGWARLRTPDAYWERHSEEDNRLSVFIRRETSLNMDPTWYSVSVDSLEELCRYPFIFANSLAAVRTTQARSNLVEYFKRGGFVVVDACINKTINPDPAKFLDDNKAVFTALIPGCEIKPLSQEHEIYSCFFTMTVKPPHTYHDARYDKRWAQHGLYGVYVKGRIISIITLSGLQCGWSGVSATRPNHAQECMEMMVNIYVYAMSH